jgi:hypothetical protein
MPKETTITNVRVAKDYPKPVFVFRCTCGNELFIQADDSADPVECPTCGMTWDINISVTGSMPEAE